MDKKLYLMMTAILLMVSFLLPAYAQEESSSQQSTMQDLDDLSKAVLTLTEQGKYEEAKKKLDDLAQKFTRVGFHKKISIEALELSSNTIVQGKRSFTATTPDKNEMLWHASQIRILIDALTHPNQPIWKGYYSTYLEQVSKMVHLAQREQKNDLMKALKDHMKLYAILKPAFALNHNPSTIEMLDSLYNMLLKQSHLSLMEWESIRGALEELRGISGNIFLGKEEMTFVWYISSNSPVAMIGLMSMILFTTLSYVGWRMYRGQRYSV